jgi:hypothetical protein
MLCEFTWVANLVFPGRIRCFIKVWKAGDSEPHTLTTDHGYIHEVALTLNFINETAHFEEMGGLMEAFNLYNLYLPVTTF